MSLDDDDCRKLSPNDQLFVEKLRKKIDKPIKRLCNKICKYDNAPDLINDTYLVICKQIKKIKEVDNVTSYCIGIARKKCSEFLRQRKRQEERLEIYAAHLSDSVAEWTSLPDLKRQGINAIYSILSDEERTIIDRKQDRDTFKQIAKRIGKKSDATRKQGERLYRFIGTVCYYYFEFLTIEEIAEELKVSVNEINVCLRQFEKRYEAHYTAAFEKLSSENKEIINLRVKKKMDFPTIAEEKKMDSIAVGIWWSNAQKQLLDELNKRGIPPELVHCINRREQIAEKKWGKHESVT